MSTDTTPATVSVAITVGDRTTFTDIPRDLADRMADTLSEWRQRSLNGMTTPETWTRADMVADMVAALRGEGAAA